MSDRRSNDQNRVNPKPGPKGPEARNSGRPAPAPGTRRRAPEQPEIPSLRPGSAARAKARPGAPAPARKASAPARRAASRPAGGAAPHTPDLKPELEAKPEPKHRLTKSERKQRKELRKRVVGKPGYSGQVSTLTQTLGRSLLAALKLIIIIVLLLGSLTMGVGAGMLSGYFSTAQEVEVRDLHSFSGETKILGKSGELLASLKANTANSEFVPIEEIKQSKVAEAFIAIEDERFETHPGIDFKRIGSAVFSAIANAGSPTHGGSTITQQTIKLISGKDEISAQRKIQEWYNAVRLEQRRSKDNILELYLNLVPMANNYVGVGAAAKAYFNKPVKELSLGEAAFLAGIPNRPATYNPLTEYGRRNALRRQRFILSKMLELEKISAADYEQALNDELIFDFSAIVDAVDEVQSYAVDYVIEKVQDDLINKLGYSAELARIAVYNYGLTIESTIDGDVQTSLEGVFKNRELFVTDPALLPDSPEEPQASITVLDNADGAEGFVRGMVGGYGEKRGNFTLNRAVYAYRQPGSSIKPILVYGPALDAGKISMATPFNDRPVYLDPDRPDTPYPENYSKTYIGPQSLEEALALSLNTIAAEVYAKMLTPQLGLSYLKQCGIDRSNEPYVAGALGGFAEGMSSYEMAGAYSPFANDGIYVKPRVYLRVLNSDGSVLLDNTQRDEQRVYRSESAGIMTYLLTKVAEAPWNQAVPDNTPAAGKTGTTDLYTDVWFCGYTPYYTAAVWYGYDNANGRHTVIPIEDGKNAVRIWRAAMQSLHENLPRVEFTMPSTVETATVCRSSGMLATEHCPSTMSVYLVPGSAANPSESCTVHKKKKPKRPRFPWDRDDDDYDYDYDDDDWTFNLPDELPEIPDFMTP
ncbi:MAG: transglycosylase domain-containing protein [Eubacteriales bacterium]|nr:transglycosylase domain-containing protein [Eubacteriales bacterium]